jgi:hypothetical protein
MKREFLVLITVLMALCLSPTVGLCDYHHGGENDSPNFLAVYPDKAGTKVDSCALCHKGGSYVSSWKTVTLGSCQWCHYIYGITAPHGDVMQTLNAYGTAYNSEYQKTGNQQLSLKNIEQLDSDGDGTKNIDEIQANTYPGDATDYPGLKAAPCRIYTRSQIQALPQHTQFLLMNTTRQVDNYCTYTGVSMKDLLDDAHILSTATGIKVFSPDGFSMSHPLQYDAANASNYHVYGNMPGQTYQYPQAQYWYDPQADTRLNPPALAPYNGSGSGWCDYSAASCVGRSNGDSITVGDGGLKAILAIQREGAYLDKGILNSSNTLDGEGPFRVVVPQKSLAYLYPDQSKTSSFQSVLWPFQSDADHNAGACTRSATIIKVEPLPAGTTDINTLEAGWAYVDNSKIVIYGAIDGSDSNGNGVLDSEENADGTSYYKDPASAYVRHAKGLDHILIQTSKGNLANVQVMKEDDSSIPTNSSKPSSSSDDFPYGAFKFNITGLTPGDEVTVTMTFPNKLNIKSRYYKISQTDGTWTEVPITFGLDGKSISMILKDGGPLDADGKADGTILDPGALYASATASPESNSSGGGGGGGGCFITMASDDNGNSFAGILLAAILFMLSGSWLKIRFNR